MKTNEYIVIFDSGFGGISIFNKLYKLLPKEKYIYFADSKNNPFGEKNPETILLYVKNALDYLIKKNIKIKLFILACNTATLNCYSEIVKLYPNIKIIGTKPEITDIFSPNLILNESKLQISINPTDKTTIIKNKQKISVLIICTTSSKNSTYINDILNDYKKHFDINCISMQKLVYFVENDLIFGSECSNYIFEKINEFKNVNYLIIACTHFHFVIPIIKKYINKNTIIIDNADTTVKNSIEYIKKTTQNNIVNSNDNNIKTKLQIVDTNISDDRKIIYNKLLDNNNNLEIEYIDI